LRKQGVQVSYDPPAGVQSELPEWRRQGPRAPYHRSAFADCSVAVRTELRESRAKMLVEKNKTALVEAECNRRRMEAKLKCQVIEREVEAARLKAEAETNRLIAEKMAKLPPGFAETIVSEGLESVFTVPQSLSSGSISPNSSVSVDMVMKMENALTKMAVRLQELESKNEALEAKLLSETVGRNRVAVEATVARLSEQSGSRELSAAKRKKQAFVSAMTARAVATRGEKAESVEPVAVSSGIPTTREEIAAHVAMLEREGRMNFH